MLKDAIYFYQNPDGPDEIIEENNNNYMALREVKWKEDGNYKLDLRRYYVKPDGEEIVGKGISFYTKEGPTTLINSLIKLGYGDFDQIISDGYNNHRDEFMSGLANAMVNMDDDELEEFDNTLNSKLESSVKTQSAEDVLKGVV